MYDAQIKETRDIVNSWEESVRAQKVLMAVGEATSDEVSMAEASKLEAEGTLEALQLQMIEAENALCVLLGRYSGHIERGDFQASCEQMPLIPQVNTRHSPRVLISVRQRQPSRKPSISPTRHGQPSILL